MLTYSSHTLLIYFYNFVFLVVSPISCIAKYFDTQIKLLLLLLLLLLLSKQANKQKKTIKQTNVFDL